MKNYKHSLAVIPICLALLIPAPTTAQAPELPECVVDIHSHTFNIDQLPIAGILISKGIAPFIARYIDTILRNASSQPKFTSLSPEITHENDPDSQAAAYLDQLQITDTPRVDRLLRKQIRRQEQLTKQETNGTRTTRKELKAKPQKTLLGLLLNRVFGGSDHWYHYLAAILVQDEATVAEILQKTYPDVDTFVHHLMDMEHPYNQKLSVECHGKLAVECHEEQTVDLADHITHAKKIRDKREVPLQTFVPFDPFRYVLDSNFQDTLDEAISEGAIGIKFYPPSGYRPGENCIPRKPGRILAWNTTSDCGRKFSWPGTLLRGPLTKLEATRQWQSRYKHLATAAALDSWRPHFTDEALEKIESLSGRHKKAAFLDAMLDVFFTWAEAKRIPIFSHHSPGHVKAWADYGGAMANPSYWQTVLNDHPNLTVILGHSGLRGNGKTGDEADKLSGWFTSVENKEAWEESYAYQAYKLCTGYANVYCGFGMFWELLDHPYQSDFKGGDRCPGDYIPTDPNGHTPRPITRPAALCLRKRLVDLTKLKPNPAFNIMDKILYGSDWMMIATHENHQDLPDEFSHVFSHEKLEGYRAAFFSGNAHRALGLPAGLLCRDY